MANFHHRCAAGFRRTLAAVVAVLVLALLASGTTAQQKFIILASTTSTANTGLFDYILPRFTARTGIDVRVVAVGTGAALRIGANGDADVVLVHDRQAEESFVAAGFGVARHPVMYNDFVVVGPAADPSRVRGFCDAAAALRAIARTASLFVSRGDDSGTHKAELRMWAAAGIDPSKQSGQWYLETGGGMGATLNTAQAMDAYALSDRGTWLSFENRGDLVILVEGDERLFNPYGVILVNPARHPHVKTEEGRAFIAWLTSPEGQQAIAAFRVGGKQLFIPNAATPRP